MAVCGNCLMAAFGSCLNEQWVRGSTCRGMDLLSYEGQYISALCTHHNNAMHLWVTTGVPATLN